MINPYQNVNWQTWDHIITTSHNHCKSQTAFNRLYNAGVRFFTVSNYYASEPLYPAVNNQITGIPSLRDDPIIVPNGCIISANAEHHAMGISSMHLNSLGSTFRSGNPEYYDSSTGEWKKQPPNSMNGKSFTIMVNKTIDNLLYEDGGGITINHPIWTHNQNSSFTIKTLMKIFDYSPYVLGQEVIESGTYNPEDFVWWDNILITGRNSWGFFVPDHKNESKDDWEGKNILLVPEFTEHACLKAYRNGEFYGKRKNSELAFTSITITPNRVMSVTTNSADTIAFIEDGVRTEYSGSSATHNCSVNSTYVRAEAEGLDDMIFSQPIIFKPYTSNKKFFTTAARWA